MYSEYFSRANRHRKELDKISIKVRACSSRYAVDFYYKKDLILTVMTTLIDDEFILKNEIKCYNIAMCKKRIGKRNLI